MDASESMLDGATARLAALALAHQHHQQSVPMAVTSTQEAAPAQLFAGMSLSSLGPPPDLEDPLLVEQFLLALPAFRDVYSSQAVLSLFTPPCAGCLALYLLHSAVILPAAVPHRILCALLRDPAGEILPLSEFQAVLTMLTNSSSLFRSLPPNPGKCTVFPPLSQLFLLRLGALMVSPEFAAALAADYRASVFYARCYLSWLCEITSADSRALTVTSKWTELADVARASLNIIERAR
eukprot:m.38346 g.38346  ORF g.38346 m.38346 type:complete len:238 (+) comp9970_c0_seq1:1346-2059(+)